MSEGEVVMSIQFLGEKVILNVKGGILISINVNEIMYIQTHGRCTDIYISGGIIQTYESIDEFEWELEEMLLECSKSIAVNMKYIRKVSSSWIELIDGTVLNVSRTRGKYVKEKFLRYII